MVNMGLFKITVILKPNNTQIFEEKSQNVQMTCTHVRFCVNIDTPVTSFTFVNTYHQIYYPRRALFFGIRIMFAY